MSQSFFGKRLSQFLISMTSRSLHHERRPRAARFPVVESLENRALLASAGIDVIDTTFAPDPVTIHVGDTVDWVWDSNNLSTTSVKGSAEQWDSGVLNTGATFEHTFTHVGTFAYYSTTQGTDNGNGTASGMSGTITVLPVAPLTMIMLMPANYSIPSGTTQQFMAMGMYTDNTTEDVSAEAIWSSSNPAVATVSNASGLQGLVSGMAAGSATISASFDGMSGTTQFTVTTPTPNLTPTPMPTPMPMPSPTSTPTSTSMPTPPALVSVGNVQFVRNKKHMVTQITVDFSGAVNAAQADSVGTYRLAMPGNKGSFTAKNAKVIKLNSAVYDASLDAVTLTPKKPFALTKPVQVQVDGLPPSGLRDSAGRLIDGDRDGLAGGNAVAVLGSKEVIVSAVVSAYSDGNPSLQSTVTSALDPEEMSGETMSDGSALSKHKRVVS